MVAELERTNELYRKTGPNTIPTFISRKLTFEVCLIIQQGNQTEKIHYVANEHKELCQYTRTKYKLPQWNGRNYPYHKTRTKNETIHRTESVFQDQHIS